ncbi:PUA domain-containing protein [Halobellus sp. EA9]|uniref:PUA domain-containing protein n=1 Tax=Halobellus sp. EA9 TaxID=3421647 RepID=UPI003EBD23A8
MSDASGEDLAELRTIADYQFGAGAGAALFPRAGGDESETERLTIHRSTSGRPRQVVATEGRVVSYGTDGRFTLGVVGGRRLVAGLERPKARVVVGDESAPFVRDGKNAFAKFVREVDPAVRPGDEVAVVLDDDTVLGVGRAELSADAMGDFETGMAVSIREGAGGEGDEE